MTVFHEIYHYLYRKSRKLFEKRRLAAREKINQKNIALLKNKDFSLFCNNCTGAIMLHDLHLRFNTPTVNLWFEPAQYIEFLKNLEYYLQAELSFSDALQKKYGYPVGLLDHKIRLYFKHYETREEALEKWQERARRVNFDNLFILFTEKDGCTLKDIADFDALPYKNKIIFTHKPYPQFKSAFFLKRFRFRKHVGNCYEFIHACSGIRYYDELPYVQWFNGEFSV